MLNYTIRRTLIAIPTLIFISLIIFLILNLAPSDPLANQPLTVPPEVREKMRIALGLDQPLFIRYLKWCQQFFINEPLNYLEQNFGIVIGNSEDRVRVISWQTRGPVIDLIAQRIPQTLTVVGLSYVIGILIAVPLGVISAYKQYSIIDQIGTFISMVGFSIPTFFSGVMMILIFSVWLGWFPSIYDTTHQVTDWSSFVVQVKQMVLPVMVLSLYNAAQISRYTRSAMLENLTQDYVRTARAKGASEKKVVLVHVLRNSMIPVITVIALGVPTVFGGAIITEQVFKINGLGQLLITGIYASDVPLVQSLTFIFAVLIVVFNLIADLLYGILDPRIRYD